MTKQLIFIMSLAFVISNLKSQNYQISFAGQGASATVDSVIVENLMQNTSLKLGGNQILNLIGNSGINDINAGNASALKIFPNPFSESCNIEFETPVAGNAVIKLCDITGKEIAKAENYLQQGNNEYLIYGINSGVYYVQISSKAYLHIGKLINNNISCTGIAKITIQNVKAETPVIEQKAIIQKEINSKESAPIIQMQYNTDDRLKITGISGVSRKYRTLFMLIPTNSQTVTFNFVPCIDADSNNYSIVQIGTQLWMAENLKYLPSVVGSSTGSNVTPYYYVNGYDGTDINAAKTTANYNTYGVLYNWTAAMAGSASSTTNPSGVQGVCPIGWHLPSDAEWIQLTTFVGETVSGFKLKETGTNHWNSTNEATNETGFTALPCGSRNSNGSFVNIGSYGSWWNTTENGTYLAWYRYMVHNDIRVLRNYDYKDKGLSVRCIKD